MSLTIMVEGVYGGLKPHIVTRVNYLLFTVKASAAMKNFIVALLSTR